jgi:hypothetical protein
VRAEHVPDVTTSVVPVADLDHLLPPVTGRVDLETRRAVLARRSAAVRRRFAR